MLYRRGCERMLCEEGQILINLNISTIIQFLQYIEIHWIEGFYNNNGIMNRRDRTYCVFERFDMVVALQVLE